jgi:hypothetical protein
LTDYFASHRRLLFVTATLVGAAGCNFMNADPPEIAKPLEYYTVDAPLPGCATRLPPVHDGINCGALEIGKSIDVKDVCHLLQTLKQWVASAPPDAPSVHQDDWIRVRAVCVSRSWWAQSPHDKRILPPRSFLRLEADVPDRSQRMFVQMSEQSRGLEYWVAPRRDPWTLFPGLTPPTVGPIR